MVRVFRKQAHECAPAAARIWLPAQPTSPFPALFQIMFTKVLARRLHALAPRRLLCSCFHPGIVQSSLWRHLPSPLAAMAARLPVHCASNFAPKLCLSTRGCSCDRRSAQPPQRCTWQRAAPKKRARATVSTLRTVLLQPRSAAAAMRSRRWEGVGWCCWGSGVVLGGVPFVQCGFVVSSLGARVFFVRGSGFRCL